MAPETQPPLPSPPPTELPKIRPLMKTIIDKRLIKTIDKSLWQPKTLEILELLMSEAYVLGVEHMNNYAMYVVKNVSKESHPNA